MKLAYALDASQLSSFAAESAAALSAGFDAIEIVQATPEALGALGAAPAAAVCCISAATGYSGNASDDADAAGAVTALIDSAASLGCPVVAVGETIEQQSGDLLGLLAKRAAWLSPLAAQAQRRGVTLAFMNSATVATASDLWKLLETVGSPSLGICWTPPRALQVGGLAVARGFSQSPHVIVPTLNTRLAHVRFNWVTETNPNSPLAVMTQRLAGIGYRGAVSMLGIKPDVDGEELEGIVKAVRGAMPK